MLPLSAAKCTSRPCPGGFLPLCLLSSVPRAGLCKTLLQARTAQAGSVWEGTGQQLVVPCSPVQSDAPLCPCSPQFDQRVLGGCWQGEHAAQALLWALAISEEVATET